MLQFDLHLQQLAFGQKCNAEIQPKQFLHTAVKHWQEVLSVALFHPQPQFDITKGQSHCRLSSTIVS